MLADVGDIRCSGDRPRAGRPGSGLEQMDVLKGKILPLLAICLITTILTFMVSAFTIRLVTAWQKRLSKEEK